MTMVRDDAHRLVALLRGAARCRTGILVMRMDQIGAEPDLAARLSIDFLNYADVLLQEAEPQARFVSISALHEEERMNRVATDEDGTDCVLVYNLDLALARLGTEERERLWSNLLDLFPHRRRALLLAVPEAAGHLLPQSEAWEKWTRAGRQASTNPIDLVVPG